MAGDEGFEPLQTDTESDNTIHLYSLEEFYSVELWVEENCNGSEAELESVISDLAHTVVYPIAPISVNGLLDIMLPTALAAPSITRCGR